MRSGRWARVFLYTFTRRPVHGMLVSLNTYVVDSAQTGKDSSELIVSSGLIKRAAAHDPPAAEHALGGNIPWRHMGRSTGRADCRSTPQDPCRTLGLLCSLDHRSGRDQLTQSACFAGLCMHRAYGTHCETDALVQTPSVEMHGRWPIERWVSAPRSGLGVLDQPSARGTRSSILPDF